MMERQDGIGQSFYLAQLQAVKGTCDCEACQLLRKGADEMVKRALEQQPEAVPDRR